MQEEAQNGRTPDERVGQEVRRPARSGGQATGVSRAPRPGGQLRGP